MLGVCVGQGAVIFVFLARARSAVIIISSQIRRECRIFRSHIATGDTSFEYYVYYFGKLGDYRLALNAQLPLTPEVRIPTSNSEYFTRILNYGCQTAHARAKGRISADNGRVNVVHYHIW